MSRVLSSSSLAIALALGFPIPAVAQSIDYADLAAMMGEPVITSVTGKPQRASDAPASITIITRDQIARSPARDIPGLLKSYAGIDVNRWTAGQSDVAVRGGVQSYNPRLLVMVNGRQVYLDFYGFTNWALIGVQLDEIQQIELVRGPASALFGFNAASGVVNIITVDATSNRLSGTAEVGDHGISRLSLVAGLALGSNAGLRISAGRSRENQRAVPKTIFDPQNDSPVDSEALSGTLTATPGQGTVISVDAGYAHNRQLEYRSSPDVFESRVKTSTVAVNLSHDTGWGSLAGRGYVNWMDGVNPATTASPRGLPFPALKIRNRVAVGEGSILARLGSATTVRIGGEYRTNLLRSNEVLYSPEISYRVLAASAMLDAHPSDGITLTAAARIDRMSLTQTGAPAEPIVVSPSRFGRSLTALSFNAAVLVRIGADGQFRINGGRGIQAPSLLAFGIHLPFFVPGVAFPIVASGDPGIKAPQIWSGEIGYTQPVGDHLKIDAGVFYTRINDYIGFTNNAPAFAVGPTGQPALVAPTENIGDLITYGASLSLSAAFGHWTGLANYSWTRSDDSRMAADAITDFFSDPKEATPRHKINAQLGYDADRWFGTVVGRYTASTFQLATPVLGNYASVRIPAALAIDAKLGWRIRPGVTLSVAGENLTKARGAAGSPIWADRRLRAGFALSL